MAETSATLGPVPVLPAYVDEQLVNRLGIEITACEPDLVMGTMPVAGNRQPIGIMHGGANAAFAETLGSLAAWVHAGPDRIIVGLELSCTHHRAVRRGVVTGVCRPLHVGGGTATYEIVISDEQGRRTCTARLTCAVPPARRRAPGA
ncbi:aromatic compound degradation protein PaaI [Streptomyces inusitatus]|uniref:Aromatic compound degradation protein PaaI n=1 Tax=Streptomyces inusitatus TaxID=68221 RepID=A0A918Q5H9_9ACTN|nr:hotdog fold thioesterase [Streptomyces inusitatus]GGZ31639.1 aromatic compound degradation protein PaaI [Streptomyces inusitatus]